MNMTGNLHGLYESKWKYGRMDGNNCIIDMDLFTRYRLRCETLKYGHYGKIRFNPIVKVSAIYMMC